MTDDEHPADDLPPIPPESAVSLSRWHDHPLFRRVQQVDQRVDDWVARHRGHKTVDRTYYAITELADFSLLWHLVAWTRALRSDDDVTAALRLSAALGVETVLVNGIIKSRFRRERPVHEGPRPHKLRVPRTTSFPSGHASSAVLAAMLLSDDDSLAPAYWALAGMVATSRVYVKIHHASDVAAGAALGAVLGLAARKLWPLGR